MFLSAQWKFLQKYTSVCLRYKSPCFFLWKYQGLRFGGCQICYSTFLFFHLAYWSPIPFPHMITVIPLKNIWRQVERHRDNLLDHLLYKQCLHKLAGTPGRHFSHDLLGLHCVAVQQSGLWILSLKCMSPFQFTWWFFNASRTCFLPKRRE